MRNQTSLASGPSSLRSLRRPRSPLSPPPPPPLEEYYQELNKVALGVGITTDPLNVFYRVLPFARCRRRYPFPILPATTALPPTIPPATAVPLPTSTTGPSPPQNPPSAVDRVNPFSYLWLLSSCQLISSRSKSFA